MPDYIITDCGYPQWQHRQTRQQPPRLFDDLYNAQQIAKLCCAQKTKLLPLRQTLTDYYEQFVRSKQKRCGSNSKTTDCTDFFNSSAHGSAQWKYHKNKYNELKQSQQQPIIVIDSNSRDSSGNSRIHSSKQQQLTKSSLQHLPTRAPSNRASSRKGAGTSNSSRQNSDNDLNVF